LKGSYWDNKGPGEDESVMHKLELKNFVTLSLYLPKKIMPVMMAMLPIERARDTLYVYT
jgi:hypothetical protein